VETEELPHGRGEETSALPRAVLDANIYVAAYLSRNPRSPNKELFRPWRAREFVLLISKAILEEVVKKFDELGVAQQLTIELLSHNSRCRVHQRQSRGCSKSDRKRP